MKKNKHLDKLVKVAFNYSFITGKLDIKKVTKFYKEFKKLPTSQAIYCLSQFLKVIKNEQNKKTLYINSAKNLSSLQVQNIVNKIKKDHTVEYVLTQVNPLLFGGVKVKIGDFIYDFSVQNRIKQLGEALKGG